MDLKNEILKITKEYYPELNIERLSGCCGTVVFPDSDICTDCKEHCDIQETCPECLGKGTIDVRDDYHPPMCINERWRTIICPKCEGKGYIEVYDEIL